MGSYRGEGQEGQGLVFVANQFGQDCNFRPASPGSTYRAIASGGLERLDASTMASHWPLEASRVNSNRQT